MPDIKTGFVTSVLTLDGNNHLGDIKMWEVDIAGTSVNRAGIATGHAYKQRTKAVAKFNFEMVVDNTGPAICGLDASLFSPMGTDLLATLQSLDIDLKIPVTEGSGLADAFAYGNVGGGREVDFGAELLIPAAQTTYGLLTNARLATPASWVAANCIATLGGVLSFDYPVTLINSSQRGEFEGNQVVRATFEQRGTPTTTPNSGNATSLLNVAFGGDALISLALTDKSAGASWTMANAVVESMKVRASNGQLTMLSGTLYAKGAPGYS